MARASAKIVVVPKEFETKGKPPWEFYLAFVDRPEQADQIGDQPPRKDDKKDDKKDDTPEDRIRNTGESIGKVLSRA
jgi:hypothetical protein